MKTNSLLPVGLPFKPQSSSSGVALAGGWFHGLVVGVETSRGLLFLRTHETPRPLAIHWNPATQLALDGRPASTAELRTGQRVRIHCRFADDELQADSISIRRLFPPGVRPPKVIPLHPEPPREDLDATI